MVVDIDSTRGQCSITNPENTKAPPKSFTFDGAYGTNSNTETIYAEMVFPLVEVAFENSKLFQFENN